MAKHSNADLLTGSARSKAKKGKSNNLNVVFDEKSRTEYLTGFQKRNKEKKKKYLEKQKEILHQEQVEKRREVREIKRKILKAAVSSMVEAENERNDAVNLVKASKSSEIKFSDNTNTTTVLIEEI